MHLLEHCLGGFINGVLPAKEPSFSPVKPQLVGSTMEMSPGICSAHMFKLFKDTPLITAKGGWLYRRASEETGPVEREFPEQTSRGTILLRRKMLLPCKRCIKIQVSKQCFIVSIGSVQNKMKLNTLPFFLVNRRHW